MDEKQIKSGLEELYAKVDLNDDVQTATLLITMSEAVGKITASLFTNRLHQAEMLRTCVEAMEQAADRYNLERRKKGQVQ